MQYFNKIYFFGGNKPRQSTKYLTAIKREMRKTHQCFWLTLNVVEHPIVIVVMNRIPDEFRNIEPDNMPILAARIFLTGYQAIFTFFGPEFFPESFLFIINTCFGITIIMMITHVQGIDNMKIFSLGKIDQILPEFGFCSWMMDMYIARIPT